MGEGDGLGLGEGDGDGLGEGDGVGEGDGLGEGDGVGNEPGATVIVISVPWSSCEPADGSWDSTVPAIPPGVSATTTVTWNPYA